MTNKKGAFYDDAAGAWLQKLSKNALQDCVIDLLRRLGESADDPVSEAFAADQLTPILQSRGDRIPLYVRKHGDVTP